MVFSAIPTEPESYVLEVLDDTCVPHEVRKHRPREIGVLDEEGVRIVSQWCRWPDWDAIREIAREGIDLMRSLPGGAKPRSGVALFKGVYEGVHQARCMQRAPTQST